MPVRFLLGRDLPKDVTTLTLSYAFYDIDPGRKARTGNSARLATQHGQTRAQQRAPGGAELIAKNL